MCASLARIFADFHNIHSRQKIRVRMRVREFAAVWMATIYFLRYICFAIRVQFGRYFLHRKALEQNNAVELSGQMDTVDVFVSIIN